MIKFKIYTKTCDGAFILDNKKLDEFNNIKQDIEENGSIKKLFSKIENKTKVLKRK